jgi:HD-like signal output (HDOD) protein
MTSIPALHNRVVECFDRLLGQAETQPDIAVLHQLQRQLIENQLTLPPRPEMGAALEALESETPPPFADVAMQIAHDRTVAAHAIKLANSVAFGVTPCYALEDAVRRLGFATIKRVALGLHLNRAVLDTVYDPERAAALQAESLRTAVMAGEMALDVDPELEPGLAFLAALFHDVGHALVLNWLSSAGAPAYEMSADLQGRLHDTLHPILGLYYTLDWGLPREVCEAAAFHHSPAGCSSTVWVVWATDQADRCVQAHYDPALKAELMSQWPAAAPSIECVTLHALASESRPAVLPTPTSG